MYLRDLDKNMNQFKYCLDCINANNFNSIFGDFVKRFRSIIDFTLPYVKSLVDKSVFELNLG